MKLHQGPIPENESVRDRERRLRCKSCNGYGGFEDKHGWFTCWTCEGMGQFYDLARPTAPIAEEKVDG